MSARAVGRIALKIIAGKAAGGQRRDRYV